MLKHSFEREKGKKSKRRIRGKALTILLSILYSRVTLSTSRPTPLQNVFFIGNKTCLILCLTILSQRQNMYFQNYFHKGNRFLR